ncbi:hypothetical protein Tco_0610967, partial [Tanacetum coccineum]
FCLGQGHLVEICICVVIYTYTILRINEHELKGVSNSSSPNIAFLSTEVKGSTLKQSTAEPTNIPKGYTQAASNKIPTAPNCASHSDEIICSFFSQQASMPTTHGDEDLLQIDEETDVSESQKETAFNSENSETSFENRSPNSQNSVGQESRTKRLGNKGGFKGNKTSLEQHPKSEP